LGSPQSDDYQEKTVSKAGFNLSCFKGTVLLYFCTIQQLFDFSINKNED